MSARGPCLIAALAAVALTAAARADDPAAKYALDADRLMFTRVEDDAPVRGEDRNREEFEAYNTTLLHARQFPAAELERHAKKGLSFLDLVQEVRQDYQFKLVYFEGRLKRFQDIGPTKPLRDAGVTELYEAWMFPVGGDSPMCVLTTEKPDGLEPAREYTTSKLVAVAGYSFKLIRYESAEKERREANGKETERHVVRRAPLLMARSLTLLPEHDTDGSAAWREGFFPALTALVGGLVAVIAGLAWWFARGDRAVRDTRSARQEQNPFDG